MEFWINPAQYSENGFISVLDSPDPVILDSMQFTLAHIGTRSNAGDEFNGLTKLYLERTSAFVPCDSASFRTEKDFVEWLDRKQSRGAVVPVLLDSRGKQMNSDAFASWIGARRDQGTRHIVFAIGPADGWSDDARAKARLLISLGQMTLAHSLARLVLAEQLYRACTILAGHPYHTGH